MKYELIKDTKETRWWRQWYTIEADSLDEAIKIANNPYTEDEYGEEIDDSCESMHPIDNDGNSTIEIFWDNHEKRLFSDRLLVYDNVNGNHEINTSTIH